MFYEYKQILLKHKVIIVFIALTRNNIERLKKNLGKEKVKKKQKKLKIKLFLHVTNRFINI